MKESFEGIVKAQNRNTLKWCGFGAGLLAITLVGCSMFGSNPSAPSKTEAKFFDIATNVLTVSVIQTNQLTITNTTVVQETNTVGITIPVTNYAITVQPLISTNEVTKTNYTLTPKAETMESAQTIGAVTNTFVPGLGGLIAGILGGIFTMWGKLRSAKETGGVLAQDIEAIRTFIKTSIPNGTTVDAAMVSWLQDHQQEAGALDSVMALLKKYVNNTAARNSATEIQNALDSLLKQQSATAK